MKYNLSLTIDRNKFQVKCNALMDKGAFVEVLEKNTRTLSQNSYLHLLLGALAMELGESLGYCKRFYFKELVNPDVFVIEKNDKYIGKVKALRSSVGISKEVMSSCIDRLKIWASQQGIYLPDANETEKLQAIERDMALMRQFL